MDLCLRRSLRGGALPYSRAFALLLEFGWLHEKRGSVSLSAEAERLLLLIDSADEPHPELVHLLAGLAYARGESRRTTEAPEPLHIDGRVSVWAAETEIDLEDAGLLVTKGGRPVATSAVADLIVGGLSYPQAPSSEHLRALGDLAERLSVRYLRERFPDSAVVRVSLTSDRFGFDILVTTGRGDAIAYEVKGSTATGPVTFFVSRNEIAAGQRLKNRYVLLVWGRLVLNEEFGAQYARLVRLGFPQVVENPSGKYAPCWTTPPDCSTAQGDRFRVASVQVSLA